MYNVAIMSFTTTVTRSLTALATTNNDTYSLLHQLLEGQNQILKDQQQLQQTICAHNEKLDILVSRITRIENVLKVDSPPSNAPSSSTSCGGLQLRDTARNIRNSEDRLEEDEVVAQTRPGSRVSHASCYACCTIAHRYYQPVTPSQTPLRVSPAFAFTPESKVRIKIQKEEPEEENTGHLLRKRTRSPSPDSPLPARKRYGGLAEVVVDISADMRRKMACARPLVEAIPPSSTPILAARRYSVGATGMWPHRLTAKAILSRCPSIVETRSPVLSQAPRSTSHNLRTLPTTAPSASALSGTAPSVGSVRRRQVTFAGDSCQAANNTSFEATLADVSLVSGGCIYNNSKLTV